MGNPQSGFRRSTVPSSPRLKQGACTIDRWHAQVLLHEVQLSAAGRRLPDASGGSCGMGVSIHLRRSHRARHAHPRIAHAAFPANHPISSFNAISCRTWACHPNPKSRIQNHQATSSPSPRLPVSPSPRLPVSPSPRLPVSSSQAEGHV